MMLTCTPSKAFGDAIKALKMSMDARHKTHGCILVETPPTGGGLCLTATDGGMTLSLWLTAEGGSLEPVLLPGTEFLKAVRGAESFSWDGSTLVTDHGRIELASKPLEDFPLSERSHAKDSAQPIAKLDLSKEVLAFAVTGVSPDPTKPALSRVLLDLGACGLNRLVSSDGYRLVVAEAKAPADQAESKIVIPPKAMNVLQGLVNGPTKIVLQGTGQEQRATFRGPGWVMTIPCPVLPFPSYEKVLPSMDRLPKVFTFRRKAFLEAVVSASRPHDEYNKNLQIYLADGSAFLEFVHPDGPVGSALIPMVTTEGPICLAFDHRYLEDIARTMPGESLSYCCRDEIGQGTFVGNNAKSPWSLRTILMPVRFASMDAMSVHARVLSARNALRPGNGLTCRGDFRALDRLLRMMQDRRTTLPILKRVVVEGTGGALRVHMTDMEATLTMDIPGHGVHDPVLVEAASLRAAIKGADHLTLEDGKLITAAMNLATENKANSFPEAPELHRATGLPLAMAPLTKAGLEFSISMASKDKTRPNLAGVLLDLGETVRFVSTDGFRLAVADACPHIGAQGQYIFPARVVPILGALLHPGESTEIRADDRCISFRGQGWTLTVTRICGNYPAYRNVVPAGIGGHSLRVVRKEFQRAMNLLAAKADAYNNRLTLSLRHGSCNVELVHPDAGRAAAEFSSALDGPEGEVTFQVDYLEALAESLHEEEVAFHFEKPNGLWTVLTEVGGFSGMAIIAPTILAKQLPSPRQEPEVEATVGPSQETPGEPEAVPEVGEAQGMAPASQDASQPLEGDADELGVATAGDTVMVWRQDSKAVRALGGRDGLKAAKFKVKWEIKQSKGFTSYLPQGWNVPKSLLADLGITPMSEAEAMAIFRQRSANAKARTATAA